MAASLNASIKEEDKRETTMTSKHGHTGHGHTDEHGRARTGTDSENCGSKAAETVKTPAISGAQHQSSTPHSPCPCSSVSVRVSPCVRASAAYSLSKIKNLKGRDSFQDIDLQFADFILKLANKSDDPLLYLAAAIASNALHNSHICVDLNRVAETPFPEYKNIHEFNSSNQPQILLPTLDEWTKTLKQYPELVSNNNMTPLILDDSNRLYLHRYWNYECELANLIRSKCNTDLNRLKQYEPGSITSISKYFNPESPDTDWQQVAVFTALVNDFTLITGGPGTGKTTVVSAILAMMLNAEPKLNIKLCAPTGKAAARLKESINDELKNLNLNSPSIPKGIHISRRARADLGLDNKATSRKMDRSQYIFQKLKELETYTIHRLLGGIHLSPHFKHDETNKLSADIIIVDEASMVSLPLFTKLFKAISSGTKIILLGDKDQLSSVEAGAVLANICEAAKPNCFSEESIQSMLPYISPLQNKSNQHRSTAGGQSSISAAENGTYGDVPSNNGAFKNYPNLTNRATGGQSSISAEGAPGSRPENYDEGKATLHTNTNIHTQKNAALGRRKSQPSSINCKQPTTTGKQQTVLTNCIVELTKSYRFDDSKGIGLLKNAINTGSTDELNKIQTAKNKTDELIIENTPDSNHLKKELEDYLSSLTLKINGKVKTFDDYINTESKEEALAILSEFKILCSHRRGIYGVENINRTIWDILSKKHHTPKGIPVMITENNDTLDLYNGDVGILWNNSKAYFYSNKDDNLREFSLSLLPAYEEVFAMTIHKSQGSGFQKILMILPDKDSPILTRELLYTGITRAKKQCEIWTNEDILTKAVARKTERNSGLKDRISLKA